jgi:hypothetical protein
MKNKNLHLSVFKRISIYSFISLVVVMFLSSMVYAQTAQTNFSGTWTLNTSKSTLQEQTFAPKTLSIVQKNNDISIERGMNFNGEEMKTTDKFTLDGKECQNAGFMNSVKKTILSWSSDGKVLTFTSTIKMEMEGQSNEMKLIEVYTLKDDKTLSVESSMNSSFGDSKETQVFDKGK